MYQILFNFSIYFIIPVLQIYDFVPIKTASFSFLGFVPMQFLSGTVRNLIKIQYHCSFVPMQFLSGTVQVILPMCNGKGFVPMQFLSATVPQIHRF